MAIPAVLILGGVFWLIFSCFKYWYFSRTKINYTHKLDDKVLEEIRRPPKHVIEKIMKMKRDPIFVDEPKGTYPYGGGEKTSTVNDEGKDFEENRNKSEAPKQKESRPLNIFEEIELRKNEKNRKRPKKNIDRSIFEDSLTKLHREILREKQSRVPTSKEKL